MKLKLATALLMLIFAIDSCTKTGNTIAPTNTITATVGAGTSNAYTVVFTSVPSTSTLANGTPFYTTAAASDALHTGDNIILDLNNTNCSYPNFVSGTYNLCRDNCQANSNNSIQIVTIGPNQELVVRSTNNGSVTVNYNNGTATGTFSFNGYGGTFLGFTATNDTMVPVTGSFSLSY
jgi:hypothetical protein